MSTTIHQLINSKKNLAKASVSPITVSFGAAPEKITEASSSTSIANVTASQISVHSTKNSESNAENSLGLYSPIKTNNEPSESIDPNKSVTALDLIKNIQQTRCPSSQPSSPKLKEENQGYTESFSWIKGIFNHSVESLNGFGFYTPGPSMEGISGSMISQYFSQQKSTADEPAPLTGLVFGVPLQVATLNSLLTRDVPLPAIVIRCVEYLDNYGLNEIGLYRIPGGTSEVMQLKNQFDCGSDLDLSIDPPDPNAVATLLKSFLRELPESILTPKIYKTIQNYMSHYHSAAINSTTVPKIGMMAGERVGGSNKNQLPSHMDPKSRALAEDIGNLVSELPDCNYYLLHWITRHLSRVDSNHQINKMSTSNLSVIFCPTLGIPSNLFKLMVDFNQIIFPLPKPTPQNTKRNLKIKSPRPFSASSISDHLSAKSSVSSISSGLDHLKLKKLDPMNYFNFKLPSQNSSNVPSARNSQDSHKLKNSDSAERFKSRLRKQNPGSRVISPRLYRDFTIVGDMFNIKNPSMLFQGHSSRDSNSGSMKSEVSVKSRNSILSYQSTSINTYPKLTETLQRSKSNRGSQNGRNSHTSLEEIMKPFQELGQNKSQITDEPSTISKDPKDMDHLNLDSFQTPSTIYRTPLSTHVAVDLPTTPNTEIVGSPKEFDASQLDESTILNLFPRIRSKPNSRANSRKGSTSPTSSPTQHKTVTSPSTSSQSPAQQKLGALITPKIVPTPTPAPTTPVAEEIKPDDLLNKLRQGLKKTGIKMVPDDQEEQNQS